MGKSISDMSLRDLRDKANFLKKTLVILVCFIVLLIMWMVYQMATGGKVLFGAMLPLIVAIFLGALPSFLGLASIKKEVEKRIGEREQRAQSKTQ